MENLTPKEIYEQKKKEKFTDEVKNKRLGKFQKILIWLLVILVAGGGIYWLANREKKETTLRNIYAVKIEGLVHNLEHGYIWISYRPDAAPEIIKQLESFYSFGKKIIVEPRKENDKLIALAAWNWLDKFDPKSKEKLSNNELKRISDFIDAYIGQGPEPNAP